MDRLIKELEKEAEQYRKSTANKMGIEKTAFLAGTDSVYVKKLVIIEKAQVLKKLEKYFGDKYILQYKISEKINELIEEYKSL